MNTTNFFVELIVIGLGTSLALLFLFYPLLGEETISTCNLWLKSQGNGLIVLTAIPIVYLLGIIADRLADGLVHKKEEQISKDYFASEKEVQIARARIYHLSERLTHLVEYNRSRLRICRGWLFNSILLLISLNILIWTATLLTVDKFFYSAICSISLLVFIFLNYRIWYKMTHKEFQKLLSYSNNLKNMDNKPTNE